ncbi:hypothetical protein [Aliagarivorans taiwanensis]|uniref:hypothetical protein n=1 Tax=Aliagarivorans taiwanensis TaxID=561966 RepID=UPI00047C6592|nr:hypothetical protein [Aliagarivorans taiwanensis]
MSEFGEHLKFFNDDASATVQFQYVASKQGKLTLQLQIAPLRNGNADYNVLAPLQLTTEELHHVCACVCGIRTKASGAFHGEQRSKGFQLHNNNCKGMWLTQNQRGQSLSYGLTPSERTELMAFSLRRLAMAWHVSVSDVMAILRQSFKMDTAPHE